VPLDILGKQRRFYVTLPVGSSNVADLVIGFHGRGRSGEHVARDWRLGQGERAYIGMYPDGTTQPWFHSLVGWDTRSEASSDLAFYDAMVKWARTVGSRRVTRH
jgi:poly(3-hydroxybutyrate) depolymerase